MRDKGLLLLFCKLISSFPSTIEDSVFSLACFFSIYLWHLSCFLDVIYLDSQFFLLDLNVCVCRYRDGSITTALSYTLPSVTALLLSNKHLLHVFTHVKVSLQHCTAHSFFFPFRPTQVTSLLVLLLPFGVICTAFSVGFFESPGFCCMCLLTFQSLQIFCVPS